MGRFRHRHSPGGPPRRAGRRLRLLAGEQGPQGHGVAAAAVEASSAQTEAGTAPVGQPDASAAVTVRGPARAWAIGNANAQARQPPTRRASRTRHRVAAPARTGAGSGGGSAGGRRGATRAARGRAVPRQGRRWRPPRRARRAATGGSSSPRRRRGRPARRRSRGAFAPRRHASGGPRLRPSRGGRLRGARSPPRTPGRPSAGRTGAARRRDRCRACPARSRGRSPRPGSPRPPAGRPARGARAARTRSAAAPVSPGFGLRPDRAVAAGVLGAVEARVRGLDERDVVLRVEGEGRDTAAHGDAPEGLGRLPGEALRRRPRSGRPRRSASRRRRWRRRAAPRTPRPRSAPPRRRGGRSS